jgi:hypothetical protein
MLLRTRYCGWCFEKEGRCTTRTVCVRSSAQRPALAGCAGRWKSKTEKLHALLHPSILQFDSTHLSQSSNSILGKGFCLCCNPFKRRSTVPVRWSKRAENTCKCRAWSSIFHAQTKHVHPKAAPSFADPGLSLKAHVIPDMLLHGWLWNDFLPLSFTRFLFSYSLKWFDSSGCHFLISRRVYHQLLAKHDN